MNNILNIIKAIAAGFVTGFVISIPLGPAGIESVKRTISKGYKEGFSVSLGALSADLAYLMLINCGLSKILSKNEKTEALFWIISGIILTAIGYISLMKKFAAFNTIFNTDNTGRSLPFLAGFLITFSNPMTLTMWLTLSGTIIRFWYYVSTVCYYAFLLSLWCGMVTWFAMLNLLAFRGFKILTPKLTKGTNYILKTSILIIGLAFVVFGIIKLFI